MVCRICRDVHPCRKYFRIRIGYLCRNAVASSESELHSQAGRIRQLKGALDVIAYGKLHSEDRKFELNKNLNFTKMTVKMYGADWCSDCITAKNFLNSKGVIFEYIIITENNDAIDFLKNIIKCFPKDPNIPAIISHCYILNNNLEKGATYLDKAKNINPDIPSVGWNETRLFLKQKKASFLRVTRTRRRAPP